MVIRVEHDPTGEAVTSSFGSRVQQESTTVPLAAETGYRVKAGIGSRIVSDTSELSNDDVITIDGMSLKVQQARELGLIGRVSDEGLSTGAIANAATAYAEQTTEATEQPSDMTALEANINETALGELELAGLNPEEGIALIEQLANGDGLDDITSDHRVVAQAVETKVTAAAENAAATELGPEAFTYLQNAAAASPEVSEAIRGYAIQRATGQAQGATWSDLYSDILHHMNGS
jgi:hypothetical protein